MSRIIPTSLAVACLVAVVTVVHEDRGSVAARLLLGVGCAGILLIGIFAAPALRSARPFATDGSAQWQHAKQAQLWSAGIATAATQVIFNPGIAVMVGIVVAMGVGAAGAAAESTGD